jgi:hypothetical protein
MFHRTDTTAFDANGFGAPVYLALDANTTYASSFFSMAQPVLGVP